MPRIGELVTQARRDWREIGGLGRIAVIGIAAAALLTLGLGFFLTATVRSDLLESRAVLVHELARDLPRFPGPAADPSAMEAFDAAVRDRILGGETLHVKVWADDGTLVYQDEPGLVGRRFPLSPAAEQAFAGARTAVISGTRDPAHSLSADLPGVIEIFFPVEGAFGTVWVMEVEQETTSLDRALGRTTRTTWFAIGLGLGVLGLFMVALLQARARDLNDRRRQAERLLASSFRAREEERRRVVGALHDDVGQPLYRLLYGLEGARAKAGRGDVVADDLGELAELVREIDGTLRRELRELHQDTAGDTGLGIALEELAASTEAEAGLDVAVGVEAEPSDETARTALYRAAREAVTNVRKHARARHVGITVTRDGGAWRLAVVDDGVGYGGSRGLGLTTMAERFESLGGGISIERRSVGTRLEVWLPEEGVR